MNVKNLGMKFVLVSVLVAAAIYALYPPEKRLKPGIDLAGGHSLLYEIDTSGLEGSQLNNLSERIITQLRRRVDPNNQRNLIWRPMGNTRIEIQMPSATGRSVELRTAKEEAINELLKLDKPRLLIQAALEASPDKRPGTLVELARGVKQRVDLLTDLAQRYDELVSIKAGQSAPDGEQNEVSAYKSYEQAMQKVLATNLTRVRLSDILSMGPGGARDEQIENLKSKFPAYADGLDLVVQPYDLWAKDRSMLEDPEDLKRLLKGAGVLEFRIMAERDDRNPSLIKSREAAYNQPIADYVQQLADRGPRPKPGQPYHWFKIQDPLSYFKANSSDEVKERYSNHYTIAGFYADEYYALAYNDPAYCMLAGTGNQWKLVRALGTRDFNTGKPIVQFGLDPRGGDLFGKLTRENIGRQLGIFLDNECMSSANIVSEIRESGVIQGDFSVEDISYLVNTLEAGSLPARLKEPPLSERSIGSSLGETNRSRGFTAAVGGLILVTIFMLVYYLFCGIVADIALVLNVLFVLSAMAVLEATFTLPGIAGLILTLGMAVDANVLILERIREELRRGTSLKMAVKNGYEKAFSTILDANVTTLITCVILGYAGSDEVKGFAIVLGLGVTFSMFTSLFVTRIIFAALIQGGILKSLPMLRLIGEPRIKWIDLKRVFWPISLVLVSCGGGLFLYEHSVHKSNIYDIEFIGGTAVTIELNPGTGLTDEQVRATVNGSGPDDRSTDSAAGWLRYAADQIKDITVKPGTQAGVFELGGPYFNAQQLEMIARVALQSAVEQGVGGGVERLQSQSIRVSTKLDHQLDSTKFKDQLLRGADYLRQAANRLSSAKVVVAWDTMADRGSMPDTFDINTIETNKELVRQAIMAAMGNDLKIQRPIEYVVRIDPIKAPNGYYPIHDENKRPTDLRLGDVIGGDTLAGVDGRQGGVAMVFEQLDPPQTADQLRERLHSARLLPEFEKYEYRPFSIVGLSFVDEDSDKPIGQRRLNSFALLVSDESVIYEDDPGVWQSELAATEMDRAQQALSSQKTLQKVTQFDHSISAQATQKAIMAILLALVAIVIYIWIRFGNMQFGLAAIVALVHDVTISLGCVAASYYVYSIFGENVFLVRDFKIDLPMVAALLTIVGYSLNDTIVVFDRVRENRGKLKNVTADIINLSINQTLSRTVLTSLTTMLAVGVMYVFGGVGIHGFSFAMIIGVVVGTYSSMAIATPLLLHPKLLKWILLLLVGSVLVGWALASDQGPMQIWAWVPAGVFGLIIMFVELRRIRGAPPRLAHGAA